MADIAQLTPPPRATGNAEQDFPSYAQWFWDFYNAVLARNDQIAGTDDDFDPGDLPDPASSSIAQAQQTANEAYTLAAQAKSIAEANIEDWVAGQITVSGAATTGVHTFADAQPDADYKVQVQPVSIGGAPTVNATLVTAVTKTVDDLTITVNAAPGVGNSVTFDFLVYRIS